MGWNNGQFIIASQIQILPNGSIKGTNWILNQQGYFQYSGTPATGNLIQSYAPVHGTDAFGNAYPGQTPVNDFISANGQTFTNNLSWYLRSGGGGVSYTGLIMAPGLYDGQQCQIVDTDAAATLTMAAAGVSNVAGGTANVIGPNAGAGFVWITPNNLWFSL